MAEDQIIEASFQIGLGEELVGVALLLKSGERLDVRVESTEEDVDQVAHQIMTILRLRMAS